MCVTRAGNRSSPAWSVNGRLFARGHRARRNSWFFLKGTINFPGMPIYPLRKLPTLPIAGIESQWLEKIAAELKSGTDRADLCRRTLCEIAYPQFAESWETAVEGTKLTLATPLALSALQPRNCPPQP